MKKDIQSAKKYREPKRVKKLVIIKESGFGFPICPTCGGAIEREYMSFCSSYGQRLSWYRLNQAEVVNK